LHRNNLIQKLEAYSPEFEEEKEFRARFLSFVKNNKNCFERSLLEGHVTGSSWIVNKDRTKALLTHHFKLDKWLQLGGHADGESDIIKVATTEALEESGLKSVKLVSENIFDIDIHTIPERKNVPEHLHYDVRFLFEADESEKVIVSNESNDVKWLTNDELQEKCKGDESILRMVVKVQKGSPLSKAPFIKL